jgi:Ala-tRNA(Pro) deacylase
VTAAQVVVNALNELGIVFDRIEHPPVATVAEAEAHWADVDATHCKNLFLRNQKGDRHYLVILAAAKRADLRQVAEQIGDGKLSFASPERLMKYLGVTPGSVSPFGLIHDADRRVRVVIDAELRGAPRLIFHRAFHRAFRQVFPTLGHWVCRTASGRRLVSLDSLAPHSIFQNWMAFHAHHPMPSRVCHPKVNHVRQSTDCAYLR